MNPAKDFPFFTELGKLQNWIRSISHDLTKEMDTDRISKVNLYKIWYTRDAAILRLYNNLQKLENEIAFFFTENGCRKATENSHTIKNLFEQFALNCKLLSNEYFNIKLDYTGQNIRKRNNTADSFTVIYKRKTASVDLLNKTAV